MLAKTNTLSQLLDCAPGLLGRLARYINATQITDQPGIALGTTLAFLAALRSERITTAPSLGIAPSLYTLVLAYSGSGKTSAQHRIIDICTLAGVNNLFMGQPASDSGILTRLGKIPRQFLVWDEFGQALSEMSASSNSYRVQIISLIMNLYSYAGRLYTGKEYVERERVDLSRPFLSISAASTPGEFYRALTKEFIEKGFLSRWLVFEGSPATRRKEVYRGPVPLEIVEEIRELNIGTPSEENGNLTILKVKEKILTFHQDNIEDSIIDLAWSKIGNSKSEPERILWSRASENWYKVCMCIAGADGGIDTPSAFWAWDLVEYLVEKLIAECEKSVHDNAQDRIKVTRLQKFADILKPGEEIPRKTFTKLCFDRGFSKLERQQLLSDMLDSGEWVEKELLNPETSRVTMFLCRAPRSD